jgi:hypothetical protein
MEPAHRRDADPRDLSEARDDQARADCGRMFGMSVGEVFSAEDLFIFEQVQSTLEAGANDDFVLDPFEQHLRRFHGNVAALLVEDEAP